MSSDFIQALPAVNSTLNGTSALLLVAGVVALKAFKNEDLHKKFMLSAFVVSAVFLALYLVYHYTVGHVVFGGEGTARIVYFTILISHIILSVVMLPFIFLAFRHAFLDNREKHKKMVHIAFPMWLYVSVTGVAIYVMVWHLYPHASIA